MMWMMRQRLSKTYSMLHCHSDIILSSAQFHCLVVDCSPHMLICFSLLTRDLVTSAADLLRKSLPISDKFPALFDAKVTDRDFADNVCSVIARFCFL